MDWGAAIRLGPTGPDDAPTDRIRARAGIPVSLKPIDAALPPDLGNRFSVVMAPMPIGITDHWSL